MSLNSQEDMTVPSTHNDRCTPIHSASGPWRRLRGSCSCHSYLEANKGTGVGVEVNFSIWEYTDCFFSGREGLSVGVCGFVRMYINNHEVFTDYFFEKIVPYVGWNKCRRISLDRTGVRDIPRQQRRLTGQRDWRGVRYWLVPSVTVVTLRSASESETQRLRKVKGFYPNTE